MPKRPYPRWQRRHDAVLQFLLQNPSKKLNDCARAAGYSPSQVSRIVNSPDFQEHFRAARKVIERDISMAVIRRLSRCRY